MSKNLVKIPQTVPEILNYFDAKDWRCINHGQIEELFSIIPQLNSEVAIEVVKHFPEMLDTIKSGMILIKESYSKALTSSNETYNRMMDSFDKQVDLLMSIIERGNISDEVANEIIKYANNITDAQKEITKDKISEDTKKFYVLATSITACLGVVASVLNNKKVQEGIQQIPKLAKQISKKA